MVTAVYSPVPPTPAKLRCFSTVIHLHTRSQVASPQGHNIKNSSRKLDGILGATSLLGVFIRLPSRLFGQEVTKQRYLAQLVCGVSQKQVFLGCKQR